MDQLEEIKSKIDIVSYINERVPLKKMGRNFKAPCPFHSEDTPSFVVSPERQIFKCFGCGEGGDIFGFVMKYENLEFGEALKLLADKAGVKLSREYKKQASSDKDVLYKINFMAAEFFQHLLLKENIGAKARDYLKKRNITAESVKKFKLGYAPDSWELTGRFLQKKGYTLDDMTKAGLVVRNNSQRGYYDRFRERLMFPIFDLQGNIVGFSGRILRQKDDAPKYLNTSDTPIYNKSKLLFGHFQARDAIRKEDSIILTEGNIDIISAHQAGVEHIVAPLGTALTSEQVKLIKRFTDTVYLCFDSDTAGVKAAHRGIELLEQEELDIKVIQLVGGSDIDECLQKDPEFLKTGIEKAIPIYDFYLQSALDTYERGDPFSKDKVVQGLIPLFAKIKREVIRSHYLQQLASALDIDETAIFKEAQSFALRPQAIRKTSHPKVVLLSNKKLNKIERVSRYLVALTLQKEELTSSDLELCDSLCLENEEVKQVWDKLYTYVSNLTSPFLISEFYAKLEPEEVTLADDLLLMDISYLDDDARELERQQSIKEIKKIYYKKELKKLHQSLQKAEEKGNTKDVGDLTHEINTVSRKIHELE